MLQSALLEAETDQKELEGRMAKVVASEVLAKKSLEETKKKLLETEVQMGRVRKLYGRSVA